VPAGHYRCNGAGAGRVSRFAGGAREAAVDFQVKNAVFLRKKESEKGEWESGRGRRVSNARRGLRGRGEASRGGGPKLQRNATRGEEESRRIVVESG